jgi:ATP adenylyltransferase
MAQTTLCDFCYARETEGDLGRTVSFLQIEENRMHTRTVYESENFIVIATLGQFIEGYLLLLTKEHYPAMAHLEGSLYNELEILYKKVRTVLGNNYVRPIIFEHGPMPSEEGALFSAHGGGSCVDHAHIHFIPIYATYEQLKPHLFDKYTFRRIDSLSELKEQALNNMPYLYVELDESNRFIFDTPEIASQYMRRILGGIAGAGDKWNFRAHHHIDSLVKTVSDLRSNSEWGE